MNNTTPFLWGVTIALLYIVVYRLNVIIELLKETK